MRNATILSQMQPEIDFITTLLRTPGGQLQRYLL